MKRLIFIPVFLVLFAGESFAHKEWVHQYLVKEAYKFLERELRHTNATFNTYFGLNFYGPNNFHEEDNINPWGTTNCVTTGVWQEDVQDIVWDIGAFGDGWDPSTTHFWNADGGDNSETYVPFEYFPNAYTKARAYYFGRSFDENYMFLASNKHAWRNKAGERVRSNGRYWSYPSLTSFLRTGSSLLHGYIESGTDRKIIYDSPKIGDFAVENRQKYALNILGRISHLLADMSCPAHTHDDIHPCGSPAVGDGDVYELEMGSNLIEECNTPHEHPYAENWNANTAREQGGLLWEVFSMCEKDAIRYLFYTMNQLSDHFPSIATGWGPTPPEEHTGDNDLVNGDSPFLSSRYTSLGGSPDPSDDLTVPIANETFNYAIRATASLFYYFLVKAELSNCLDELLIQNQIFYGLPSEYTKSYIEAVTSIKAGTNVFPTSFWPVSTQGPVLVDNSSNVVFRAGQSIQLVDQFHVESGATFHAFIGTPSCQYIQKNSITCPELIDPIVKGSPNTTLQLSNNFRTVLSDTGSKYIVHIPSSDSVSGSQNDTLVLSGWYHANWSGNSSLDSTFDSLDVFETDVVYSDSVEILDENDSVLKTISHFSKIILNSNGNSYVIDEGGGGGGQYIVQKSTVSLYPNPSISEVLIKYHVNKDCYTSVDLLDVLGKRVREVVPKSMHKAGDYEVKVKTSSLVTGNYFVSIQSGDSRNDQMLIVGDK